MKRKSFFALLAFPSLIVCCLHRLGLAQTVEVGAVRAVPAAPGGGVAPLPSVTGSDLGLSNPALSGGILLNGLPGTTGLTPSIAPRSGIQYAAPQFKAPVDGSVGAALALPAPAAAVAKTATPPAPARASVLIGAAADPAAPTALDAHIRPAMTSAQTFAAQVAPNGPASRPGIGAAAASDALFDANTRRAADVGGTVEPGAGGPTGNGGGTGGGAGGNGGGDDRSGDDHHLGKLHSRVVVILDTLKEPASAKLVEQIETLIQHNVHVVFVTARPARGENSADSVLVSKLKTRTGNPVVVVSYNGARVEARSSKAENPKPLFEDLPGFAPATIAKFREINERLRANFSLKEPLVEFGSPSLESAHIYGAELPAGTDMKAFVATYNKAIKTAGFLYKVEASQTADGRPFFFTQSTALKLNTGRIFKALYAQFPELNPATDPDMGLRSEQVLVLADPAKAPSFLATLDKSVLPGQGFFIHGVTDAESTEKAIGGVLGKEGFEKIYVHRSELREYVEWLAARQRYGAYKAGRRTGKQKTLAPYYHDLAFYRGIIVKDLMGRLYHLMRKGQFEEATLDSAIDLLTNMWKYPKSNGVRLPIELEAAAYNPKWKGLQRGHLEITKQWLKNYYRRNFRDYPRNMSERVAGHLINLARDGKNSVPLDYTNPHTGRRYVVGVLPDRAELTEDDKGYVLAAHVYRTGREPYAKEFDEMVEANLVGRAMLEGYAQKRDDGQWYVNDEPNPRVRVFFHYNTRDLDKIYTPAELESFTPQVTALIESRDTNADFKAYQEQKKAEQEKAKAAAERALKRRAADKKSDAKTGK